MIKIVVLDGYTLNPGDLHWDALEKLGTLTVLPRVENNPDKVIQAIADAEIVFTNKTVLSKEVLQKTPRIKYIGVLATGYNIVDIETAKSSGITVTNVPAYSTNAVAQFTFALLLEMASKVGLHQSAVQQGEWTKAIDFSFTKAPLLELYGKTLGIIGFGRIGQAVSKIAQAFGMKVMVYSNKKYPELEADNFINSSLDQLLHHADMITLHCPLTEKTKGIIHKNNIKKMKDGVLLVNTSRGGLVVEQDLKMALHSGKIAGAGIDVVSKEPISGDNPLLTAQNCIITPHIAWAPKEARERLMHIAVENLKLFLNGKPSNVIS